MQQWVPYAEGDLRDASERSLKEICQALQDYQPEWAPSLSLWEGGCGIALALQVLGSATASEPMVSASLEVWETVLQQLEELVTGPGLYTGIAGPGWVDAFVAGTGNGGLPGSVHEELEPVLLLHLERCRRRPTEYDLISGLVGIGVYALERQGQGLANRILSSTVQELLDRAAQHEGGCTWLSAKSRTGQPGHFVNLGMAHGVPGVIAFLGRARAAGCLPDEGVPILESAVQRLMETKTVMPNGFQYPSSLPLGTEAPEDDSGRLAWCYGDLGIAAALLTAGICCERDDWSNEAVALALNCTTVPYEASGVVDHGLCHGAIGVAHILGRMASTRGCHQLRSRAQQWLEKTLESRVAEGGVCGFARMRPGNVLGRTVEEKDYRLTPDYGFLLGIAGVGLALLAATSEHDPGWDRALLLSD